MRFVLASVLFCFVTTACGQTTCKEGDSSCAATQEDVTNLMQVKSQVSRHGQTEVIDDGSNVDAWRLPKAVDDKEMIDLGDIAVHKDFKILAMKIAGMDVAEEEMDGFYSRSKIFFKEPLSAERSASYCWKRTERRCPQGEIASCIGSIPKKCPTGTKKGEMATWLPICFKPGKALQDCKPGWRDDFLYCRKPEYGRGFGHFTQSGCLDNPMTKELKTKYNAAAECHKPASSPLIWYPKCRPGFDNFGCCICRPLGIDSASCKKEYGASSYVMAGSSCYKGIDWSTLEPHYPGCDTGKEMDAGLCYNKCGEGFKGVGPVCWEVATGNAISCGMGLAKTDKDCSDVTSDQVFSVAKAALNLATLGTAGPAVAAVQKTVETVEIAYATASDLIGQVENGFDKAGAVDIGTRLMMGKTYLGGLKEMAEADDAADAIRGAAKFAAQFDPTGVAQIIGAFTYKKCPGTTGLSR